MAHIFVFGSSSAYGYHDSRGGWSGRLKYTMAQRVLHGERPAPNVSILATPARTFPTIVRQDIPYAASATQSRTKLGLFLVGPADARIVKGQEASCIPPDDFRTLLQELSGLCIRSEIQPMLVGLPPIDNQRTDPFVDTGDRYRDEVSQEYDAMVREHAQVTQTPYIDTYSSLTTEGSQEVIAVDGLHLNDNGHGIVHRLVLDAVDSHLADRARSNSVGV